MSQVTVEEVQKSRNTPTYSTWCIAMRREYPKSIRRVKANGVEPRQNLDVSRCWIQARENFVQAFTSRGSNAGLGEGAVLVCGFLCTYSAYSAARHMERKS